MNLFQALVNHGNINIVKAGAVLCREGVELINDGLTQVNAFIGGFYFVPRLFWLKRHSIHLNEEGLFLRFIVVL